MPTKVEMVEAAAQADGNAGNTSTPRFFLTSWSYIHLYHPWNDAFFPLCWWTIWRWIPY